MATVRRIEFAFESATALCFAVAALFGCDEEDSLWEGRCAVNGGGYSITTTYGGEDTTFEGSWGECVYNSAIGGGNPYLYLIDSRVTVEHDEEANTFSTVPPDEFKGIIDLAIGMAPVEDPGAIPVEGFLFEDWIEFSDASLDGDVAMAEVDFYDDQGMYYLSKAGNDGTLVIDDVDWPGPNETGELVLQSGDDLGFPAVDNAGDAYTAKVAMDADLTLTTVPAKGESGSMLGGITTPVGGDLFQ